MKVNEIGQVIWVSLHAKRQVNSWLSCFGIFYMHITWLFVNHMQAAVTSLPLLSYGNAFLSKQSSIVN